MSCLYQPSYLLIVNCLCPEMEALALPDCETIRSNSSPVCNLGCALRVELFIVECTLPSEITTIALVHQSCSVIFDATTGFLTTFHIIAPLPNSNGSPSTPITLGIRNQECRVLFEMKISVGMLLDPHGMVLTNFFRGEGTLALKTKTHLLLDPIRELPTNENSTIELINPRMPAIGNAEKLEHCARETFKVPPVLRQCTLKENHGAPTVERILSPRALWTWSMNRPDEYDGDGAGEYIDVGDGVFAPKKNVAKLQMAMGTEDEKCRIPAAHGKMTLLQACVIKPLTKAESATIALGPPIDLRRSPVILTQHLLKQSERFIEDVDVSDSESEDEDDASAAANFHSGDHYPAEKQSSQANTESNSRKSSERVPEAPAVAKMPSVREKIQAMMNSNDEEMSDMAVRKLSSVREKVQAMAAVAKSISDDEPEPTSAKFGISESDEESTEPTEVMNKPTVEHADDNSLASRLASVETERDMLRCQLESAYAERDRLIEQLRAQSLASKCVKLEAELLVLRQTAEKAKRDKYRLQERLTVLESGSKSDKDSSNQLRAMMSKKEENMQTEYDRLLDVIANLNEELSRQPDQEAILEELLKAKEALVLERVEKEEFARELAVLKVQLNQATTSPTRISEAEKPVGN